MKRVAGGMAIVASLAGTDAYAGFRVGAEDRDGPQAVAELKETGETEAIAARRPAYSPITAVSYAAPVLPSIRATIGNTSPGR